MENYGDRMQIVTGQTQAPDNDKPIIGNLNETKKQKMKKRSISTQLTEYILI